MNGMILTRHFCELDRLLRGRVDVHPVEPLAPDSRPRIDVSAARLAVLIVLLGIGYGICIGSFAVVSGRAGTWKQMLSSAIKVPALFFLTLAVTFPSLYVFGALGDSNLTARTTWPLLVATPGGVAGGGGDARDRPAVLFVGAGRPPVLGAVGRGGG